MNNDLSTFILCSKISLINTIDDSHPRRLEMVKFIKEATDNQILSFLVTEKFSREKVNLENQSIYLNHLKSLVVENKEFFYENMGFENVRSFLYETQGPVSTAKLLLEAPLPGVAKAMAKRGEAITKARDAASSGGEELVSGATKVQAGSGGAGQAIIDKGEELTTGAKKAASAGESGAGQVTAKVTKKITKVANNRPKTGGAISATIANKPSGSGGAMASLYALGAKAGVSPLVVQIGVGLTAAAIAALVTYAAFKTYQRFFSKAAKACKGQGGPQKTACMNKFKMQATQKQISELKNGMRACSKSKNPAKCKQSLAKRIAKLSNKSNKFNYKATISQNKADVKKQKVDANGGKKPGMLSRFKGLFKRKNK